MRLLKSFIREFKIFALGSNFVSMAVGIAVGGALTKIVGSFVEDIVSPILGMIIRIDFKKLSFKIFSVEISYGSFIMSIINAMIVLFSAFLFIRMINKLKNKDKNIEDSEMVQCPYCKTMIKKDATRCPNCTSMLDN